MANPYLEIFKAPGSVGFSLTGFIARIPIAMISIGLIAMLSELSGSYGSAGYVAAAYVLSNAILSPQLSRLADCYGQQRVVIWGTLVSAISLCLLLIAAHMHFSIYTLIILGIMTGFMPSFGSFVRARWSMLYSGLPQLRTAFAFESIIDEMIFMAGPIIALFLTTHYFPAAGPLAAVIFLITGASLFLTQHKSEPPIITQKAGQKGSVIRQSAVFVLTLTLVAIGSIFGTAEITALAFAKELDQQALASLPLAAYALGSFITGIIYGSRNIQASLARQFVIMITLAAITTLPLLIVSDLWSLGIVLFIAGAACSPTIIITMALIESSVPAAKLTEGMSWAVTGLSIGVSIGAAISGHLIDNHGATSGFYLSIIMGFIALMIALAGQKFYQSSSRMHIINNN